MRRGPTKVAALPAGGRYGATVFGVDVPVLRSPMGALPPARLAVKSSSAGVVRIDASTAETLGDLARDQVSSYLVRATEFPGVGWALRVRGAIPERVQRDPRVLALEARLPRRAGSEQDVPLEELLARGSYVAAPLALQPRRDYLTCTRYDADVLPLDNLIVIDDDTTVTLGWLWSQAFWVWSHIVSVEEPGATRLRAYMTFPAPPLGRRNRQRLEIAVDTVLRARSYGLQNSLENLYLEMPRPLLEAHDQLDQVVNEILGLPPNSTDNDLVEHLPSLFVQVHTAKLSLGP